MNDDSNELTLRDVALAASERLGGVRGRALDREAKKRGLTLSYTTVDKIIAGTYKSKPKPETLNALAELSGIGRDKVYEAAKFPPPAPSLAEELGAAGEQLTPAQRKLVIDTVNLMARQNRIVAEALELVETHGDMPPSMTYGDMPPWVTYGDIGKRRSAAGQDEEVGRHGDAAPMYQAGGSPASEGAELTGTVSTTHPDELDLAAKVKGEGGSLYERDQRAMRDVGEEPQGQAGGDLP